MRYLFGVLLLAGLLTPSVMADDGPLLPCPYPYYPFCGLQPATPTPTPAAEPAPAPKPTPTAEERLIKDDRPQSDEPAHSYTPTHGRPLKSGVYRYSFGTLIVHARK